MRKDETGGALGLGDGGRKSCAPCTVWAEERPREGGERERKSWVGGKKARVIFVGG